MNNPREIIIAIDAMGGDYGPNYIIKGAFLASKKMSKIKFIFFGKKEKITPLLEKNKILDISEIVNTEQTISNNTKPTDALRKYRLFINRRFG